MTQPNNARACEVLSGGEWLLHPLALAAEAIERGWQVRYLVPAEQPLTSWQRNEIIMKVKTVGEAIDMVEAVHNITATDPIPAPQLEAAQAIIDTQAAQAWTDPLAADAKIWHRKGGAA